MEDRSGQTAPTMMSLRASALKARPGALGFHSGGVALLFCCAYWFTSSICLGKMHSWEVRYSEGI